MVHSSVLRISLSPCSGSLIRSIFHPIDIWRFVRYLFLVSASLAEWFVQQSFELGIIKVLRLCSICTCVCVSVHKHFFPLCYKLIPRQLFLHSACSWNVASNLNRKFQVNFQCTLLEVQESWNDHFMFALSKWNQTFELRFFFSSLLNEASEMLENHYIVL